MEKDEIFNHYNTNKTIILKLNFSKNVIDKRKSEKIPINEKPLWKYELLGDNKEIISFDIQSEKFLQILGSKEIEFLNDLEQLVVQNLRNPSYLAYPIEDPFRILPTIKIKIENDKIVSLEIQDLNGKTLPRSIGNLLELKEFDIWYNPYSIPGETIKFFPESIGNLESLESLRIDIDPFLETLSESLWDLISLKHVSFLGRGELNLSESIQNFESLQSLSIISVELCTLPKSIGNLYCLKKLNLEETKLAELPDSIGNLRSLHKLNLNRNQLKYLPYSIGDLKSLKELNLEYNQLLSIPESIGNLISLKELNIRGNDLSTLPNSIKVLEKRGVNIIK